jgi:protein-S-isoprenylcysteine O-methyltransferase Ste14
LAFLTAADVPDEAWPVLAAGTVLILAGTAFAIVSLLTLRTSFGLFPEARALVTAGPYRWVRHPVYLGEILAAAGLVLPAPSARNVAVFGLFCALQYWRALKEERALEQAFPEYSAYRRHTWRLVPWLH